MKPVVKPLAYWHRKLIFSLLLMAFLIGLPAFMFYSSGYRYDFFSENPTITSTGGLYIAADSDSSSIYLNEVEVNDARVFRQASYIQGLDSGIHRVHVQAPGLHTWVKELLVLPHLVTEAEAFNLPIIPQIRPVTKYVTEEGEAVFFAADSAQYLAGDKATTSVPFISTSSPVTRSYLLDPEFSLLEDLFLVKASTTTRYTPQKISHKTQPFGFSSSTTSINDSFTTTALNPIIRNNLQLYQVEDDVYVEALGVGTQVPHYFCTNQIVEPLDIMVKGYEKEEEVLVDKAGSQLSGVKKICRTIIKIDRQDQEVKDFDFLPENTNLILMHLTDGIYVVEVDDRSWQNSQLLYPGTDLEMLIYGGSIFIKENGFIFEVLTQVPAN